VALTTLVGGVCAVRVRSASVFISLHACSIVSVLLALHAAWMVSILGVVSFSDPVCHCALWMWCWMQRMGSARCTGCAWDLHGLLMKALMRGVQ
jgi:hypothetical protein